MKRRHLLIGMATATAAGVGLFLFRPDEHGVPHIAYFSRINQLLKTRGKGRPTLLIDLDRFDRNCTRLIKSLPTNKNYRIVDKSLPSVDMIKHVMQHTGTKRVMCFHQPFVNVLADQIPDADLLIGKPMPVKAAETFYRTLDSRGNFNPEHQLQWLIDTQERLLQYQQMALALGIRIRVNIEIDVGLHRGGLTSADQLKALLDTIAADPAHLIFAGFMGYDAHIGHIPAILESKATTLAKALATYSSYVESAQQVQPQLMNRNLVLNGAGSPTFRLHDVHSPLNEVSVGSALVKPADYDLDLLADFEPASFIAAPVIKAIDGLHLPGAESISQCWALWDRNKRRSYFVYGGIGGKLVSPQGLEENSEYEGMLNAAVSADLQVDDYVFMRSGQSESVFLQYGDIAVIRDGEIVDWWPVMTPGPVSI